MNNTLEDSRINKGIGQEESESIDDVSKEVPGFEGMLRNISLGFNIEAFKTDTLEEKDVDNLISIAGRQEMGKVMRVFEQGDYCLFMLSPDDPNLKIKNLNDNVLGYTLTDKFIMNRRIASENATAEVLSGLLGYEVYPNDLSLQQNFKAGVFRLPVKDMDVIRSLDQYKEKNDTEIISDIINAINDKVEVLLSGQMDELTSKSYFFEGNELKRQEFLKKVGLDSYRLKVGFSQIDLKQGKSKEEGILLGVTQAAVASHWEEGGDYSLEKFNILIDEVLKIQEKLKDSEIVSEEGVVFQIFSGFDDFYQLNTDIIRLVRKEKLNVKPEFQKNLELIKTYIKALNTLDFVKTFTIDELKSYSEDERSFYEDLDKSKLGKYREEVVEKLESEEKDSNYLSEARALQETVNIQNCTYIHIDFLDVGVTLLQDYERNIQLIAKADNREVIMKDILLRIGDKTTLDMQRNRKVIYDIMVKHGLTEAGTKQVGFVGGDEVTLIIDNGELGVTKDKINAVISEIKSLTKARVINTETSMGYANRDFAFGTLPQRIKEHAVTKKLADEGSEIAKKVENHIRNYRLLLLQELNSDLLKKFNEFIDNEIGEYWIVESVTQEMVDTQTNNSYWVINPDWFGIKINPQDKESEVISQTELLDKIDKFLSLLYKNDDSSHSSRYRA